ncbi:MAG: hypothetical protein FJ137_19970 [Deltaproteobacteria bacterium]|nr:hypothetical protein [Deltaproteobacteria bacterium]
MRQTSSRNDLGARWSVPVVLDKAECVGDGGGDTVPAPAPKPSPPRSAYRLDWAALLKRAFAVSVMVSSRCDRPMKVIATIEEPTVFKAILTQLGLPAEPLPAVHAQATPTTAEMVKDP